ncbi:MAG: hypothetical protein WBV61_06625 [Rhodanobacteraceae bacterium]
MGGLLVAGACTGAAAGPFTGDVGWDVPGAGVGLGTIGLDSTDLGGSGLGSSGFGEAGFGSSGRGGVGLGSSGLGGAGFGSSGFGSCGPGEGVRGSGRGIGFSGAVADIGVGGDGLGSSGSGLLDLKVPAGCSVVRVSRTSEAAAGDAAGRFSGKSRVCPFEPASGIAPVGPICAAGCCAGAMTGGVETGGVTRETSVDAEAESDDGFMKALAGADGSAARMSRPSDVAG